MLRSMVLGGLNEAPAQMRVTAGRDFDVIAVSIDPKFLWSLRNGKKAGNNPWNATGPEWQTSSPPSKDNYEEKPVVTEGVPRLSASRLRPQRTHANGQKVTRQCSKPWPRTARRVGSPPQ